MKRFLIVFLCLMMVGCGQKKQVFLEKDGDLYEIGDQVSFYYPKEFEIDTSVENKNIVRFLDDDETMWYSTVKDDTDNKVTDMPDLYQGQLKMEGASQITYNKVTLESGLDCYNFSGFYSGSGIKFNHIVYFTHEATYCYAYEAAAQVYDENVMNRSEYLLSLTVHHD